MFEKAQRSDFERFSTKVTKVTSRLKSDQVVTLGFVITNFAKFLIQVF